LETFKTVKFPTRKPVKSLVPLLANPVFMYKRHTQRSWF